MTWIETIIVIIVISVGAAIFYKGLKEPIDLFLGMVGKFLSSAKDKIFEANPSTSGSEITYG